MHWQCAAARANCSHQSLNVKLPPAASTRADRPTALCSALVRIEIRPRNRRVTYRACSVLECGQALVPEVCWDRRQRLRNGVSYALPGALPLYEDGPGNGK
jgi:hypothetical protein